MVRRDRCQMSALSKYRQAVDLDGTQTLVNLKAVFEAESAASVMYRWCAQQADVEGHPDAAKRFNAMAEAKVGQALGHLEYLSTVGDPATGASIGDTDQNLEAAKTAEQSKATELLPAFVDTARSEGLEEIAEWIESQIRANTGHGDKFSASLDNL